MESTIWRTRCHSPSALGRVRGSRGELDHIHPDVIESSDDNRTLDNHVVAPTSLSLNSTGAGSGLSSEKAPLAGKLKAKPLHRCQSFFSSLRPWCTRRLKTKKRQSDRKRPCYPATGLDGSTEQRGSLAPPQDSGRRNSSVSSATSHTSSMLSCSSASSTRGRRVHEAYEKHLTAHGDDRRKPSCTNLGDLMRTESLNAPCSRPSDAAPGISHNNQDRSGKGISLMERALERHQKEKLALFRFKGADHQTERHSSADKPVFSLSFDDTSAPRRPAAPLEDIDPLHQDKTKEKSTHLHPVAGRVATPIPLRNHSPSQDTTISDNSVVIVPPAIWARFSSHDRKQRCGPAGPSDGVTPKDFASTQPDADATSKKSKKRSLRTRLAFSSGSNDSKLVQLWRYYRDVITSGKSYNRRTSITTAGLLKNPELEIFYPSVADGCADEPDADETNDSTQYDAQPVPLSPETAELGAEEEKASLIRCPSSHRSWTSDIDSIVEKYHQHDHEKSSKDICDRKPSPILPYQDRSLAIDGTSEFARSSVIAKKPSAQRLSAIYQKECVYLDRKPCPTLSEEDTKVAASIPLPSTPSRIPTPVVGSQRSPAYKLPSGPRPLNSPRSTLALRQRPGTTSELRKSVSEIFPPAKGEEPALTSRRSNSSNLKKKEVSVRRFPSVTVIDDNKGDWRSISLVSSTGSDQSKKRVTSVNVQGRRDSLLAATKADHVPAEQSRPQAEVAPVKLRRGDIWQKTSEASDETSKGSVRESTVDLLMRMRGVEERELAVLQRLVQPGV